MRKTLKNLLVAGVFAGAAVPFGGALAQSYAAPAGGLTIKNVVARKGDWAFITFVESMSDFNSCSAVAFGSVSYTQPMWIDTTNSGGRQIYASALAAWLAGRKVEGVNVNLMGTWCELVGLRMAP